MKHLKWALMLATTMACGGLAVACGDDDSANNPGKTDAGGGIDSGGGGGGGGGGNDGGGSDAGCTFATYVIGLVNGSTTPTAKPDTTLGAGCKDTTDQAEFKPLFP